MIRVTDKGYWMEKVLKTNLDTANYNLGNDWDFVFILSGSGMVRVGKSVLAQQIGYYIAYKQGTPFSLDNVVFDGNELRAIAHKLPKNSVIIYDEARGELDSKKTMESVTKNLLDFFAECGMYNHFILLVMPDFFELNKNIALSRSNALINVWRVAKDKVLKTGEEVLEYQRGYFEFYNRERKKQLYIKGKKEYGSYSVGKRNFWGTFPNTWILDRKEYDKKKLRFLRRTRGKGNMKEITRLKACFKVLNKTLSLRDMADELTKEGYELSYARISQILNTKDEHIDEIDIDETYTTDKKHIPLYVKS